jgi:hypothetical protein
MALLLFLPPHRWELLCLVGVGEHCGPPCWPPGGFIGPL